jgi:hypothetical protein
MRRRTPGVPPRMDRSSQPVAAASHGCGSGAASDREPPGLLLVPSGDSPPAPLTRARIRLQATARRSNQRESLRRPRPGRFDRGARMLSWTTTVPTEAPRAHGSMQHLRSGVLGAARAGCHQSPFAVPPSGCVAPRRAGTYLQPVRENGHRGSPCRCYGRAALYRSRIRCPAGVGSSRKSRWISSLRGSSFDGLGARGSTGGSLQRSVRRIVCDPAQSGRAISLRSTHPRRSDGGFEVCPRERRASCGGSTEAAPMN